MVRSLRGTFPGVVYQLGNLFAAVNTTLQAGIAAHFDNGFSVGLASVAAGVAIIVALLEKKTSPSVWTGSGGSSNPFCKSFSAIGKRGWTLVWP